MFRTSMVRYGVVVLLLGLSLGSASLFAASTRASHNLLIQVIDDEPGRWKGALITARNLKKNMGRDNLNIEIVVHGGGINMILKNTEVASLLDEVQTEGVVLAACGATMNRLKVSSADLYKGINVVPFGAKEIMEKQEAGWSYLRM